MTKLEKIARDLAAELSPGGEADWPRYLIMAEKVGTRLFQQLPEIIPHVPEPGARTDDCPAPHPSHQSTDAGIRRHAA